MQEVETIIKDSINKYFDNFGKCKLEISLVCQDRNNITIEYI